MTTCELIKTELVKLANRISEKARQPESDALTMLRMVRETCAMLEAEYRDRVAARIAPCGASCPAARFPTLTRP